MYIKSPIALLTEHLNLDWYEWHFFLIIIILRL